MVHRALISVPMVRNYGLAAWIIRYDRGIYEKVDNCNNMILVHKFSHLDTVHWVCVSCSSLRLLKNSNELFIEITHYFL